MPYPVLVKGKTIRTPKGNALEVPTEALAYAIQDEWKEGVRFSIKAMPLTAYAFSAIDVIPGHTEKMIDVMLAYAETDLLFYRSEVEDLRERQDAGWDPVMDFIRSRYDCKLVITEGVMPVSQSEETMDAFRQALTQFDPFVMAPFSSLTQLLGSLMLSLSVKEKHLDHDEAFHLSRIDEDYQTEKWGEDSIALARAKEIQRDIESASQFIALLER